MKTILNRLIHAPILQRDDVRINDRGHGDQAAASKTSECTHDVEEDDVGSNAAAKAAEEEGDGCGAEAGSTAQDVGESPIERLECGGCDEVRGRDPADCIGGVEIRTDYGVCGGCDGTVEAGEEDVAEYGWFLISQSCLSGDR